MTVTRHRDDAPRGVCQRCGDNALLTHRVQDLGPCCENCKEGAGSRTHARPRQPEYIRTMHGQHYVINRDTNEIVPLEKCPTARELAQRQAAAKAEAKRRPPDTAV